MTCWMGVEVTGKCRRSFSVTMPSGPKGSDDGCTNVEERIKNYSGCDIWPISTQWGTMEGSIQEGRIC